MFNISGYLERFKTIGGDGREIRSLCSLVCKDVSGIDVSVKNISYRDGVLKIKTPAVLRNSLFIKKGKILEEIENKNKTRFVVYDICF